MLLILIYYIIKYQSDYISSLLFIIISIYLVRRDLLVDIITNLSIPIIACFIGMRLDYSILNIINMLKEPYY